MIAVVGPKHLSVPAQFGGNDATYGLCVLCATRGLAVEPLTDNTFHIVGVTDRALFTLDLVKLLVSLGCEVLSYTVYFEFASPDDDCPLVPGKKWSEAFGEFHKPVQIAGRWFQANEMGNRVENDGEPLPASQWINSSVTLRTIEEVNALKPKIPTPQK